MFRNLSLTYKLALAPAIALLGLVVYVVYTSAQLSTVETRLTTLENTAYPTLETADAILFQSSRLPGIFNSAVASGELAALDEASQVLDDIRGHYRSLEQLMVDHPQRQQELTAWAGATDRYVANAIEASKGLIEGSSSFEDLRPRLDRMAQDLAQAEQMGASFHEAAYADFRETLALTRDANATTIQVGITLSITLVLLVALAAWTITRSVMNNVRGVITSLTAISRGEGDLTRRVNVDSHDEIGEMIKLFNSFLDTLQKTIRNIVEAASPLGLVAKELYSVTQSSEENAKSQQIHTDSISQAILDMNDSIQEVAVRSHQASIEAKSAAQQTVTATDNIGMLSSSINDLGDSVANAVQSMTELEEETQAVGSVLTVISSIAEQTNLLALNAAIEAARAGDQGRGFAVVADEVRNLAQRTTASTAEIQQIIQRLQHSANTVLDIMTTNSAKSRDSIERSTEAAQLLSTIAVAVNQINELNADIARYTQEQTGLSSSIQQETHVLQQDAQATAQGAEGTARLGEQLIDTEDRLRAATTQFKV